MNTIYYGYFYNERVGKAYLKVDFTANTNVSHINATIFYNDEDGTTNAVVKVGYKAFDEIVQACKCSELNKLDLLDHKEDFKDWTFTRYDEPFYCFSQYNEESNEFVIEIKCQNAYYEDMAVAIILEIEEQLSCLGILIKELNNDKYNDFTNYSLYRKWLTEYTK